VNNILSLLLKTQASSNLILSDQGQEPMCFFYVFLNAMVIGMTHKQNGIRTFAF